MVILFRERESRQKHRVMNVNCNGGSIPLICMSTNIYQTVLTQKSALVFIGVCNPFCDLCEGTQGDSFGKPFHWSFSFQRSLLSFGELPLKA